MKSLHYSLIYPFHLCSCCMENYTANPLFILQRQFVPCSLLATRTMQIPFSLDNWWTKSNKKLLNVKLKCVGKTVIKQQFEFHYFIDIVQC